MDQDDLRNGWLLRRVLGNKHVVGNTGDEDGDGDDEEAAPPLGGSNGRARKSRGKWGARGISVSADEGVLDAERSRGGAYDGQEDGVIDGAHEGDEDAKMTDPNELAKILDDDDDDDVLPGSAGASKGTNKAVGNGDEWND